MNKFQIGDKVRCKTKGVNPGNAGSGYEPNLVFVVTEVTGGNIYWRAKYGNGVIEHALELVIGDWDE